MPISAIDCISLAFEHTKRQLLKPFRFGQWVRLAFVGLLAGELGGSGGNFSSPTQGNQQTGVPALGEIFHKIDPALLASVITVLVIAAIAIMIVMAYISSVMRFILFDSVLTRECHIREGWNRRQDIGWKYFLWQLGLLLATFVGAMVLIGGPAAFAYKSGWFRVPRAHLPELIVGGLLLLSLFLFFMIALALVHVFTKDFVVPQMAFEGIGALEAWRRLWPMIEAELKGYAIYIGMKIVLTIVAGIAIAIVTVILGVIFAVPVVAVIAAAVVAGKSAALTWNVFTITAAVVAACILFLIFFFFVSLISVPVIVFFPAFSIYFFAPRYRPLSMALYSPARQAVAPQSDSPPFSPPPLPAV